MTPFEILANKRFDFIYCRFYVLQTLSEENSNHLQNFIKNFWQTDTKCSVEVFISFAFVKWKFRNIILSVWSRQLKPTFHNFPFASFIVEAKFHLRQTFGSERQLCGLYSFRFDSGFRDSGQLEQEPHLEKAINAVRFVAQHVKNQDRYNKAI